jgi:hypothetical protein
VKEHVLDEGQCTLDEQEYEVNDHAAPICGFRFKYWCDPDLPSLPYGWMSGTRAAWPMSRNAGRSPMRLSIMVFPSMVRRNLGDAQQLALFENVRCGGRHAA